MNMNNISPVDFNLPNSHKREKYILDTRLIKNNKLLEYSNGLLNINNKLQETDKNLNIRNKPNKKLYLTNDYNNIEKNQIVKNKETTLFDEQFNKSKKYRKEFLDQPAVDLNRFYKLYKNPQVNCVEPFIRGGNNSVLEYLDNFEYNFNC
jgi:hypothetical protein